MLDATTPIQSQSNTRCRNGANGDTDTVVPFRP
jgi:hypothetical protein